MGGVVFIILLLPDSDSKRFYVPWFRLDLDWIYEKAKKQEKGFSECNEPRMLHLSLRISQQAHSHSGIEVYMCACIYVCALALYNLNCSLAAFFITLLLRTVFLFLFFPFPVFRLLHVRSLRLIEIIAFAVDFTYTSVPSNNGSSSVSENVQRKPNIKSVDVFKFPFQILPPILINSEWSMIQYYTEQRQ